MKSHHIVSCCFFLFFTFSNPLAAAQVVLDSDQDPLQPGVEYYAKYLMSTVGGPSLGDFGCPKYVVHDHQTDGLPISILPKAGSDIVESSDVYIDFTEGTGSDCDYYNTTIWRINRGVGGTTIITAGGDFLGGEYASFSDFQIVKLGSAYIFTNAGRFISNRGSSLGVNTGTEQPYQVVFLKKSSSPNVIQQPK